MKLLSCFKVCLHVSTGWSFIGFKIKQGDCLGNFKLFLTLKSRDCKVLEWQKSARLL